LEVARFSMVMRGALLLQSPTEIVKSSDLPEISLPVATDLAERAVTE
jgi:hypothetical protein